MPFLVNDLKYGARMLAKSKGFTLVSVLVLALGVGATTVIFSIVNGVLLRPLPYPQPERLVSLWGDREGDDQRSVISYPDFEDWRAQTQTLEHVCAFRNGGTLLRVGNEAEPISGVGVSSDLFPMLGVRPALGRPFTREEERADAPPVILIGHDLWRNRFNSDPDIVGRQIKIGGGGVSTTVVGVLPAGFVFPANATRTDSLRPVAQVIGEASKRRGSYGLPVVARLKPGVSVKQAQDEMRAIGVRLEEQYPDEGFRLGATFVPLEDDVVGKGLRRSLLVLLGAVSLVLLIGCANVANLLLARAAGRQREMAIRTALGAGRGRIVRQLLTESLLLSLVGGGVGLLLATWGLELVKAAAALDIPRLHTTVIDARVVAFAVAVSALTGVVFGVAPALQAGRVDLQEALKEGGRGASEGRGRRRLRGALVVAEVALSLVLLVGAGLLVKSFVSLLNVDPGFDARGVVTTSVSLPRQKYATAEQRRAAFAEIARRAAETPGVESAGLIFPLPMGGVSTGNSFVVEGRPAASPTDKPVADYRAVSAGYFRAMRMRLARGRTFDEHDAADAPPVMIVNETFARRLFPGEDAVGKRVTIERDSPGDGPPPAREIVGVVGDVRTESLDAPAGPEMYVPYAQAPEPSMSVVVRTTSADASGAAASLREAIRQVDAEQYVPTVRPMTEYVADSVARQRFDALLTGLFAAAALVLASVGIFGVTAYTVAQRTHEIGVRMALGAQTRDVLRMVVGDGLRLILGGVGLGVVASLALTRVLAGLLYGVSPTDPPTFAAIALLLTLVGLAACYVPARRATKVDPMVALRYE